MLSKALLQSVLVLFLASSSNPGSTFESPDKKYYIEITDNPDSSNYTLPNCLIIHSKKVIASLPTSGYIQDVFWSPNGKYVAINNRNAESGDYLWVISVADGTVIKKPYDDLPTNDITERYRDFAKYNLHKQWILAIGWDHKNDLKVKRIDFFDNISDYLSTDLLYTIKANTLHLLKQLTTKLPRNN